jgi:hypothetical protein
LERDWNRYLSQIGLANKLVIYADSVADKSLSDAEVKSYQAQGMIFRSLIYFDMVRLWGNIPVVTKVAPNITSENFDEVYPLYFPLQTPEIDTYKQSLEDSKGIRIVLDNELAEEQKNALEDKRKNQ